MSVCITFSAPDCSVSDLRSTFDIDGLGNNMVITEYTGIKQEEDPALPSSLLHTHTHHSVAGLSPLNVYIDARLCPEIANQKSG